MAGLRVGRPIPITKSGEIGGEDVELIFHVLPPDKKMADEIGQYRNKSEEELADALEKVFEAEKLFPYVRKWEGIENEDGTAMELTKATFITVCHTYPPVHGWIVECLYEAAPKKREADRGNSRNSHSGTSELPNKAMGPATAASSARGDEHPNEEKPH